MGAAVIQEQFPPALALRTAQALVRDQRPINACTMFGPISCIDTILQRAGQPVNLSTRLPWYNLRGQPKGIEQTARSLATTGTCLESLCPWVPSEVDTPPTDAAWQDAKTRVFRDLKAVLITTGIEGVKRALGQGSPVAFTVRNAGSTEHTSCIDGYNEYGAEVWDSIAFAYTLPWASFTNGHVTQLYRWQGLPLVPHPDYVEGDTPTLIDGVLSLPKALVWIGWDSEPKSIRFKNVRLAMVNQGRITSGNSDVQDLVFWHSGRATLYLPKLIVGSTILHNVTIVGPTATLISAEEDQHA